MQHAVLDAFAHTTQLCCALLHTNDVTLTLIERSVQELALSNTSILTQDDHKTSIPASESMCSHLAKPYSEEEAA